MGRQGTSSDAHTDLGRRHGSETGSSSTAAQNAPASGGGPVLISAGLFQPAANTLQTIETVPGIVGLITDNPDQEAAKHQVSQMVQCMLHDPSYSHGTYFAPELGCYLGWLSHAGAYADCNPVVDDR